MTEQRAKLRGEVPETAALDAHATLARVKMAVGLMWMNGRTDKVNEEDWELAGVVMRVSNAARTNVQKALKCKAVTISHERGRQEAEREEAKEDYKRDKTIARITERIREKLRAKNGQAKANLKRQFGRDKEYFDEALTRLVAVGDVELEAIEYQGRKGHLVCLREGR
ncbi:hypothetical protein [Mycobacterium avium]|uniref:hypothetical protein n=1 Tax=Mycobacterium avium TaxID=1764 RepID=UPI0015E2199B|nr:hypothetical protein [Mycobacterium avium]